MPPDLHPFLSSHYWSYAPVLILSAVGLTWLYKVMFTNSFSRPRNRGSFRIIARGMVTKKVFKHTEVLLDGNSYFDCKFENVTLKYNGTATTSLWGNEFNGVHLVTESTAVRDAWVIAFESGFMSPDTVEQHEKGSYSLPYVLGSSVINLPQRSPPTLTQQ